MTSITFSSNGEFFASGGSDRQLLMWKTNFDKDDMARKVPRHLVSPTVEPKLEIRDEKLQKDDTFEEEEEVEVIFQLRFYIY